VPLIPSVTRPALTPLSSLTKSEAMLFHHLVTTNGHLRQADIPMLELLCVAYSVAKQRKGGGDEWERANRVVLALARSLRLTCQSTVEGRKAGRLRVEAERRIGRMPWHRDDPDDQA
jgi:hypothetical protein